jgi:hypothetical protein
MAYKYKNAATETEAKSIKTIKVKVMRKNNKVARVSCYCKLNMLVPHLQNLSRMQSEGKKDKSRNNNQ